MSNCINDNSPKGLGYSSDSEEDGKIMKGLDNNLWINKDKKWCKYDFTFDFLPKECHNIAFIPVTEEITGDQETGIESKFGGSKPFFIKGESWPLNMTFFCQFIDPRKNNKILYRIFVDVNSYDPIEDNKIDKIELNDENIRNQIIITNPKPNQVFDHCYKIIDWKTILELKSLKFIMTHYKIPTNCEHILNDAYYDHKLYPSCGIKVGGTPQSTQNCDYSDYDLIQITESKYLPYGWGDCGIAHISSNCCLTMDCC